MGNFSLHLNLFATLAGFAGAALVAFALYWHFHLRAESARRDGVLLSYANLNLLTTTLFEVGDPKRMLEEMLDRTLGALHSGEGCLLLRTQGREGLNCLSVRGFSPAFVERLAEESLRDYIVTFADRWGSLMVFPDLRESRLRDFWKRDAPFQDFWNLFSSEGLTSLVVVGLQVKEKSYGALAVGSRKLKTFRPGELRLMFAIAGQIGSALENRFLQKAADRHQDELRLLQRIGDGLGATFNVEAQLQILRRELRGLLGPMNFALTFQDSPGAPLETVVASEGLDSRDFENGRQGDGLAEYVLRAGVPLLVSSDCAGAARRLGVSSLDPRIRTWAGIPIHFSNGSRGVLAISDFERDQGLEDRQFEFLQVLAGEVAVSVENALLFQKEQRRANHMALLNELGRKAAAVLDPQELVSRICPQIRSAFGYDLVCFESMDKAKGELVVEAEAGYGEGIVGRRFGIGEGFSGTAAQTGEPILANTLKDDDDRFIKLRPGIRSALSLPMRFGGETLGVLSLASLKEHSFSPQDVLTLRTLADQVAISLNNARAYQSAKGQAITDGLTGLKTHRYLMEALEAEWRRATRSGRHFSVIMMDLDNFKAVNDRHGHLQGDKVLTLVAGLIEARSRQSNVVARYGGDEFVTLLPDCGIAEAEVLAERWRSGLRADSYLAGLGVTASFGIAMFPRHGATPEEILRIADAGMYLAKHEQGDAVRVASVSAASGEGNWQNQLLEAYLGVAMKRMFSTGPEAFNQYLQRFQQATEAGPGDGPSLLDTVTALAFAIDAKDHYTQGHSQSVARLATEIARRMGLDEGDREEIRLAGILHDVGKIGVPESVLNKPSPLTSEEFEMMKGHATMGWKILEPLKVKAIERIRHMVRHHHERFDGEGYPDGLKAEEIPLGARIITIADSYDTMVSQRAYKKGRSIEDAMAELQRCRGTQFDGALVDTFLQSLEAELDPAKQALFRKTVQ